MRNRRLIVAAFIASMALGSVACAPPPPWRGANLPPIAVGDCFEQPGLGLSTRYDGPDNTLNNASIYSTADCSGLPSIFPSTLVFAQDSAGALASCSAASAGFTIVEQLSSTGWVRSGSTTAISDQVWGCGP